MEPIVRTHDLTKHYGHVRALESLELEVPPGVVFGYLGPNGSGKTTTIRLLVGLLRPTRGHAEVLGIITAQDPDAVQARIGYLPGDFTAYRDLTGEQYLRYLANLRGDADGASAQRLAERLELDLSRRIGTLSHGNRQKVGLVQAFMSEPELLILDEPTTGLDPLMQRTFLDLVREARDEGRTVFLSSHLLAEVEAVADHVAILRDGHLVEVAKVDELKARALRRIDLVFVDPPAASVFDRVPGVCEVELRETTAHLVVEGSTAALFTALAPYGVENVITHEADLEEIFLAYYGTQEV